jgi:phosphatidylglycerophosphate synthase
MSVEKTELVATLRETHERNLQYQDLFQIPTAISASGLALVAKGCRHIDTLEGVNYIAAGRGLDLVDGMVARAFDQESDAGALADATCDKLGMTFIATQALRKNAVPTYALASMFASNLTSTSLTLAASVRHPHQTYRPTKTGKYSMAAFNVGILSYLYANALEKNHKDLDLHSQFQKLGHTATTAGIALAIPSNAEYASRI